MMMRRICLEDYNGST